jgi:SsrA-binding protein
VLYVTRSYAMLLFMPVLVKNKKVSFDYEILEKFETGIELFGSEVKSLRKGQGKLEGSHVILRGGEAFLVGASIAPYQATNTAKSYEAERPRRLLLTQKELRALTTTENSKGLTLVPISLYTKGRRIKLEMAIVRGKKKADKREMLKKRDTAREIDRIMKGQNR